MDEYKKTINTLQERNVKVLQCLSRMLMSNSLSGETQAKLMDDYLCELENLCITSRVTLEKFRRDRRTAAAPKGACISGLCGSCEVTGEGWLHITLNMLLPNCRHRISGYIGDTISRLLTEYPYELPHFEKAFLAIVEYCNLKNHNALDNDNKGWKMIPNSLKGWVIKDDTQFDLDIGLFTKVSDNLSCEIWLMPPEDAGIFMENLNSDAFPYGGQTGF